VHFSLPTGTQPVRSLPLNSGTQSSPASRGRSGRCAVSVVTDTRRARTAIADRISILVSNLLICGGQPAGARPDTRSSFHAAGRCGQPPAAQIVRVTAVTDAGGKVSTGTRPPIGFDTGCGEETTSGCSNVLCASDRKST